MGTATEMHITHFCHDNVSIEFCYNTSHDARRTLTFLYGEKKNTPEIMNIGRVEKV